ncbi:MAG TPA: alkaline phosphatase family protein [Gemmatimonadales bacterium]|nr:alkaline phosphatase family protein [Gemmatimonadales bacterium]
MPGTRNLLVLGLDAASPSLLQAWAGDGTLPNIAKLMGDGLVGHTLNNLGFEGSTWPSFATGLNPAGHGFYWQEQLRSGTYRTRETTPADFAHREVLWELLSAAGHRVVALDVPLARRSPGLNGIQRVEWGGHDFVYGFQTTPPELRESILRTTGAYPVEGRCDVPSRSLPQYREFADLLIKAAGVGSTLARDTLAREPWDFAIQVFGESHCAGHQLWHFHDPEHPAYDPAITAQTGNLIREVYVALDAAVGDVLAVIEPGTTVVLLTLHGMSHTWGSSILLPEILLRLGVMHRASPESPLTRQGKGRLVRGLRSVYHAIPEVLRRPVYQWRQRLNQRVGRGSPVNIDPARSRCFNIHLGRSCSGIRLNLRDREPLGLLDPGARADGFCEQLSRDLLELTQPGSGRPLVRAVHRTADLFRGAHLHELPDLIVEWNPEIPLGTSVAGNGAGSRVRATSPKVGMLEQVNTYCRTGDHQLGGMFIARGPGIRPGQLGRVVSNLDLAPTFAQMMGCEMTGVDGQPIPELLAGLPAALPATGERAG